MKKTTLNFSLTKDLKKEILVQANDEDINANEYLLLTHRFYSYFKKEFKQEKDLSFLETLIHIIKAEIKTELKS
ncbi:hypothetical protein [Vallitalea guaymasensis]|uniref:hypothetical protein n=1 Tax=Vallitalea guaymasensis TaxID=1185412 RepID=UPI000DE465F2|nr:hypothetical protein [Vallitalea guaymasensis]